MNNLDKEIELAEQYAVITLPENSVEAKIEVKIFEDGELITVQKIMNMGDIRNALKMGEEDFLPPDAMYSLTDRGREWLENHAGEEF